MATLSAFYSGQDGKQINVAENGDKVNVVFTDPADNARDVEVSIVETDDPDKPHSEKNGDRTIMVVRGDFVKKKFLPNNYHIVSQISADPRRAVNISIAVGEGAQWATELPQDRPEGGRFDLRLDIKNPADGKTRKGVALLHVYYKMDIMIIPKTPGVRQKGLASWRVWAREQWMKRAPAVRGVVEMPLDAKRFADPVTAQDLAPFVKAMTTAVQKAHGGAVGIAVGHGGGALDDHGVQKDPWLNLVPEDRTGGVPHDHFRLMIDQPVLTDATARTFLSSDNFAIITAMDQVRTAIQASKPLEELRLLTCNVGKVDPMSTLTPMTQLMADRLGMPVRGYTDYIYISDPKDRPIYVGHETDVSEEAKREWPTYLSPLASPGKPPPLPCQPHRRAMQSRAWSVAVVAVASCTHGAPHAGPVTTALGPSAARPNSAPPGVASDFAPCESPTATSVGWASTRLVECPSTLWPSERSPALVPGDGGSFYLATVVDAAPAEDRWAHPSPGSVFFRIAKLSGDGGRLWSVQWPALRNGRTGSETHVDSIASNRNGDLAVLVSFADGHPSRIPDSPWMREYEIGAQEIARYDHAGRPTFRARRDTRAEPLEWTRLWLTDNGGVVVRAEGARHTGQALLWYDAAGDLRAKEEIAGSEQVAVGPDGTTAKVTTAMGIPGALVVRGPGHEVRFSKTWAADLRVDAIAVDARGGVTLAEMVDGKALPQKYLVVHYDVGGSDDWTYELPMKGSIDDLSAGPAGETFVAGALTGPQSLGGAELDPEGRGAAFVLVLDANGHHLRSRTVGHAGEAHVAPGVAGGAMMTLVDPSHEAPRGVDVVLSQEACSVVRLCSGPARTTR